LFQRIESGTFFGIIGVSYLTRSVLACITSISVVFTLVKKTGGFGVMAGVLGACYIVVLGMLCWYIKHEEKRLPYSYITNVGQLSFMGYGVLPSGPSDEGIAMNHRSSTTPPLAIAVPTHVV
jgi:O-antigen/teichoic acid export membrane protein